MAASLTVLSLHVGAPISKCREINARLQADPSLDGGYAEDLFENLVVRYEEPNGMTRWDSPLFTVPYEDETPPFDTIWEAMVGSDGKAKVVKPNMATVLVCVMSGPLPCCPLRVPGGLCTPNEGMLTPCAAPGPSFRVRLPLRIGQDYARYSSDCS